MPRIDCDALGDVNVRSTWVVAAARNTWRECLLSAARVTDPAIILADMERDVERAVARAKERLMRLPLADRRRLDPYALILRRPREDAWRSG